MTASGLARAAARPPAEAARLDVRLFGPMEVHVGPSRLPPLRSRKGLWLLALLAVRADRDVERCWLAGTLWPDSDERCALRSLRQSLHDLRAALGPEAWRLGCRSLRTLRFEAAGAAIDVTAFDAAIRRGDPASLEDGIRLYRGPLLEDCAEEWCLEERRVREQAYITALLGLAAAASARRDYGAQGRYRRLAADAEPYADNAHRALMQALADAGDPTGALLAYREFRDRLWRDLAAEPAEETTSLYRRIRDRVRAQARVQVTRAPHAAPRPTALSPARAPDRERHIPLGLTRLIGREEAVVEIVSRLGAARLVTLTGSGGVGKTRLALQVAEEMQDEFEDGARLVDLAAITDPDSVPDAAIKAVGARSAPAHQDPLDALQRHLAPRRLLLVMDNCEHLLVACAALAAELLSRCPGLRILATSREPLGVCGETVWRVPSLALPPVGVPDPEAQRAGGEGAACTYAAVRLFMERACAGQAGFRMTPRNESAIVEVCRQLDGIPLAIELAAARVRSMPVEQISHRLSQGFDLLAGPASALPRQRTLKAAIDWSWQLLSPREQALLRRLSVFAGGWSLQAAEAVCGGDGIAGDDVMDLLTALVDRSLVVYEPADAEGYGPGHADPEPRYRLLQTVRQFAAAHLAESPEHEGTRGRHRDYYLAWVESVSPTLRGADQGLGLARIEVEHQNVRAAIEWSRSGGEDLSKEARLVVALCRFWDTRGYLREGRAHLEAVIARMSPAQPSLLRATALGCAGWMAYVQGDSAGARGHYCRSLALYTERGDRAIRAQTYNLLALVAEQDGDVRRAWALLGRALRMCREIGPTARVGSVLSNLGGLAIRQGRYDAARIYLERGAAWCEAHGDLQLHGLVLNDLSMVYLHERRYETAEAHFRQGLRLLHACGAVVDIPAALDQLALLAEAKTEWARAGRLLAAAERLRQATGSSAPPAATELRARTLAAVRDALGDHEFAAVLEGGRAMDLEMALAYALGGTGDGQADA